MEYLLIVVFQFIGCGLHVSQKVFELDKKFDDDTLESVFIEFWKSDRVTLIISLLVLLLNIFVHYVIKNYIPESDNWLVVIPVVEWSVPYVICSFIIAFVLGYAGQRLVYKYLGRAEKVLSDKAEN